MANNYIQATVYPEIHKSLLTGKELITLEFAGFSVEDWDQSGNLYLYVEEGFIEEDEDEDGNKFNIFDIFQNVIKRSESSEEVDPIKDIIIEGAFTCSKMRPGEFGGFVTRISEGLVQYGSTSELLDQMRKEHL